MRVNLYSSYLSRIFGMPSARRKLAMARAVMDLQLTLQMKMQAKPHSLTSRLCDFQELIQNIRRIAEIRIQQFNIALFILRFR